MLDTTGTSLTAVAVHRVGNKLRQEGVTTSERLLELLPKVSAALLAFFLNHFKRAEAFKLTHPAGLEQNAIYAIAARLFRGKSLIEESSKIAEHLYDVSEHPRIKEGDLYVAQFSNVVFENEPSEAVGLFKAESVDTFLRVTISGGKPAVTVNSGTSVKSFDKGALILKRNQDDGFRVLPAISETQDAAFWSERFLKLADVSVDRTATKTFLDLCHSYASALNESSAPTAKAAFLDRTLRFFAEEKQFDEREFSKVVGSKEAADQFDAFKTKHEKTTGVKLPKTFDIASGVVRAQKNRFRSIIYLDDHAQLKFANSALQEKGTLVEKGFDSKRRQHFYKIYFKEER